MAASMNLNNVLPIPLEYNDYVKTAMDLILDSEVSKKVLMKQGQNVCIVYSCLGVKRNAGTKSTAERYAEVCKAFREIAVPGFFRWARDNNREFPAWLTFEKMGCTTMQSGPVLFTDGKKLWSRFDKAMREMKRDFNPIWDRFIQGQPGGNLPSGQTGDDALENLLNGLYAKTATSAGNPIVEADLVETAPVPSNAQAQHSTVGDEATNSTGVSEGAQNADAGVEGGAQRAQGVEGSTDGAQENEQEHNSNGDGAAADDPSTGFADGDEAEGASSSPDGHDEAEDYPERPTGWLHEFLLIYCLIGRPSDSEDPDLKTARKTSGPPNRPGKRRSPETSGDAHGEGDTVSSGSLGNLDSTAIRNFAGAGEVQSRAKVKKEHAAVAHNVAQEAYRQKRLQQSEKLVAAVQTLTAASSARQKMDEEAAAHNREAAAHSREVAARHRKTARIADMKGQLELFPSGSPQYLTIRSAILTLYQTPDSAFMLDVRSGASSSPAAAGSPSPGAAAFAGMTPPPLPTLAAACAPTTPPPLPTTPPPLPGFAVGGGAGVGTAGGSGVGTEGVRTL